MARNRVIPNFLYGTLGLAVVGAATYFAVRAVRARRHGDDDSMLTLRRSTRKVGRAAKDSAQQIGKDIQRGVSDTGEALGELGDEFGSKLESNPTASYNRI